MQYFFVSFVLFVDITEQQLNNLIVCKNSSIPFKQDLSAYRNLTRAQYIKAHQAFSVLAG
jgi:hypothetical protein